MHALLAPQASHVPRHFIWSFRSWLEIPSSQRLQMMAILRSNSDKFQSRHTVFSVSVRARWQSKAGLKDFSVRPEIPPKASTSCEQMLSDWHPGASSKLISAVFYPALGAPEIKTSQRFHLPFVSFSVIASSLPDKTPRPVNPHSNTFAQARL